MKWKAIFTMLAWMFRNMDPADIEAYFDSGLDVIEDKYKDNAAVIAACDLVRKVGSIEDND